MCNHDNPIKIGTEYKEDYSKKRLVVYLYGEPVYADEWQTGHSKWQESDLLWSWTRKFEKYQVQQFKEWLTHESGIQG
jgi:hypothetical protein